MFCFKKSNKKNKDKLSTIERDMFFLKDTIVSNYPYPLFHYSAFTLNNAGDNILVSSLRKSIENTWNFNPNFISQNIKKELSEQDLYLINKSKGMIIGGGGLLLKDTNKNDISGWQFPISEKQIDSICTPISILGIGYNRFRNQEDFDECFKSNINKLFEKAVFVGIRNNGSIEALKKYLNPTLHDKLSFHPCATTILSKLYDIKPYQKNDSKKIIAFNIAFDRSQMRFGSNIDNILKQIANVAEKLSKEYIIKYFVHMESDKEILKYFDDLNINYEVEQLNKGISLEKFMSLYTIPDLVIGMRGHSQMIPFGCKTPILSIISHDKMAWFLNDIKLPYGVEILDENLEEKIYTKAKYILDNNRKVREEITQAQDKFFQIINNNLKYLRTIYE